MSPSDKNPVLEVVEDVLEKILLTIVSGTEVIRDELSVGRGENAGKICEELLLNVLEFPKSDQVVCLVLNFCFN